MRQLPSDKYTIAWFKLADCVSKGEREKAFGVYRLLAHSIDDYAYALKLEGDLLFAFNDGTAFEKYEQAAALYQQHKRFKEAAALYEDLVSCVHDSKYIKKLIDLYKNHLTFTPEGQVKCGKLCEELIQANALESATLMIHELEPIVTESVLIGLYQKMVLAVAKKYHSAHQGIPVHLEKLLILMSQNNETHDLQNFLTTLEQYNQSMYLEAVAYLNTE